jgi:hypothetical protein
MKIRDALQTRSSRRHLGKYAGALGVGGVLAGITARGASAQSLVPQRANVAGSMTAVWIHANAGVVGTFTGTPGGQQFRLLANGFGAVFGNQLFGGSDFWLHYDIATPAILDGVRPTLSRIMVLFDTGHPYTALDSVEIWDRNQKLLAAANLNITGKHLDLDNQNTFTLPANTTPLFGINVALHFTFKGLSQSDIGLLITSVGADFQY